MGTLALRLEWEALASLPRYGLDVFRVGDFTFSGGYRECLAANGMECRYQDGGLDWIPCLGGRDLADGPTLCFRFHGSMVSAFCPDIASGFQFSGGLSPLWPAANALALGSFGAPQVWIGFG